MWLWSYLMSAYPLPPKHKRSVTEKRAGVYLQFVDTTLEMLASCWNDDIAETLSERRSSKNSFSTD